MWVVLFLALAQPSNPYLEKGQALAKQLKFAEAIEQLKVARQVPGASVGERVQVLELLATCLVAEGARGRAEDAFAELLDVEPDHELDPSTSPKISEVFAQVKQRLYPGDSVALAPVPAREGDVLLRVVDPHRKVAHVVLVARDDAGPWSERELPRTADGVRASLDVRPGHVTEWYVEARADDGRVLSSLGTSAEPQRRAVALVGPVLVAHTTPRLERVPAWIAVALAAAAGVAGGLLQARSFQEAARARGSAAPGDWADTARAAQARAVTDATIATGLFIGAGVAASAGVVLFAW